MKGSIRSKGKSSWQIQVYTDKGPDGKWKRYFETIHGKKPVADQRLREILTSMDKGVFTPPGNMTIGEHFQSWLQGYVKTNCSPRTYDGYESIIRRHLEPAFGKLKMKELTPVKIQAYYGKACLKLSKRTVHHQHRVLSESLKYAVRQGYLGNNPCGLCDPPAPKKKQMRTLTPSEVEAIFETGRQSYYYPIIYTAVSTGLRQAEILALRWRDMDLSFNTISVNRSLYKRNGKCNFKEPKTAGSRRRVAMTAKLALFLRSYKEAREYLYAQMSKTLQADDLVFTSIDCEPLNPSVITHNFQRIAAQAGIHSIRFHDLRHTFASLMLLRGAAPKVISEALGHASVAFTMDTYSHIIQGMQEDAMKLLDDILPAGVSQSYNANLTPSLHNSRSTPA
jgi:integrase